MGNECSQLVGLEIEEKAVEVTDFWMHNSATLDNDNLTQLSVFIGETYIEGTLWNKNTPLEKLGKNLMLHRHPCILKYVSSWNKGSKCYLAIEHVKPLSHSISSQTPLQICIGLYSILKAIAFLHDKAHSSHNNICSAAIYVSKDGSWKLGGLEYLSRYDNLSKEYLSKTRSYRYEKSIDPNENEKSSDKKYLRSGAIDKYGFSVLALELLNTTGNNSDIPCLEEFKAFCKTELQKKDYTKVPTFAAILEHPFFTHDFINIYSFLTELALKTEVEKQEFFSTLSTKLQKFPEELVARQLGELLMSRLVLLDDTACKKLLPLVFTQKSKENNISDEENTENNISFFTQKTFKQYIVPRLLHIFCVRDAQIRLLLLKHFKSYVHNFSKDQLQSHILPELLLGIKDTNDHLVAVTLIALSDLVPILGGATVIGGKRLKLFNDGRPATIIPRNISPRVRENDIALPISEIMPVIDRNSNSNSNSVINELPERLSPDGGEDEIQIPESSVANIPEEDLDSWSDWDHEDTNNQNNNQTQENLENLLENNEINSGLSEIAIPNLQTTNILRLSDKVLPRKPEITTDILSLDIKSQKNLKSESDELDFFQDMEPVIEKTNKIFIDDSVTVINDISSTMQDKTEPIIKNNNLLAMTNDDNEDGLINEDCWGDDLSWVKN